MSQQSPAPLPNRVLVLGAAGFLGRHLVESLLAAGCTVVAFSRRLPGLLSAEAIVHPRLVFVEGDFSCQTTLLRALEGCHACVHLVSTSLPQSSNADPIGDVQTNLIASLQLLDCLEQAQVRRLVFASSGGTVYGLPQQLPIPEDHPTQPICAYGITKLAIEQHLLLRERLGDLQPRILRLSNPYGEHQRPQATQGAVAVFLSRALADEQITLWGDGSVMRDYLHVSDAVAALMQALIHSGEQRIFNIGSGRGVTLRELLSTIAEVVGRQPNVLYLPARTCDVPRNVLCIERARLDLPWHPQLSLPQGVERFAAWMRSSSCT